MTELRRFSQKYTCLSFWRANGSGCAVCIRSCPFNKTKNLVHDLARRMVRWRSRLADRLLLAIDNGLGYGRQKLTS